KLRGLAGEDRAGSAHLDRVIADELLDLAEPGHDVASGHDQIDTQVAERELQRLVEKYGRDQVTQGMDAVQDYVERSVRQRIADLPDGTWEAVDYIDRDPGAGEGMIPIHIKMTIKGDQITYDFEGSHPTISSIYNSAHGATFSAVVAGMKTFFPDLPMNSGFYRMVEIKTPKNSVVSAEWPIAVTGFLMPFEKIMNAIFEMWSKIMPERAIACAFNLEYLLAGGNDLRKPEKPIYMFYEWLPGGWGGRNGKDGSDVTTACFGTGLMSQPSEGNERVNPTRADVFQIKQDSPGPGKWRGGAGVIKASTLLEAENTVMSYICDRERAVVWGVEGGLPSMPHGLMVQHADTGEETWLGSVFSNYKIKSGDKFTRPTAGGGGYGDPMERDPERVLEDVIDEYVSVERAEKDYGVVIKVIDKDMLDYEIDHDATEKARAYIRANRVEWARMDPEKVSEMYKAGEIDEMDAVRKYAVIMDWGTGELMPKSTQQFRESFEKRSVAHWS
ncbi:MAG: hydantoinase B/oxoprolinase family protein, partial [Roseovarius sp.]|nr:hydantoinase B/oxoprolinase family protein [Roseovarius sp.]